jgi:hypothetical protein
MTEDFFLYRKSAERSNTIEANEGINLYQAEAEPMIAYRPKR